MQQPYPPNPHMVEPMPPAYNPAYGGQPGVVYSQPPMGGPTVVIATTGMSVPLMFGPSPVVMRCNYCKMDVSTEIHHENGCFTWILVGGILFLGCWLGCCLIPFCVSSCKDVIHICPNCKTVQGRYSRM